jgi:hypothetical protein
MFPPIGSVPFCYRVTTPPLVFTKFLSVCCAVQGDPGRRRGGAEPPGLLRRAHGLGPLTLTSLLLLSTSYRRVVRSRRAGTCWLVEVRSGRTVHCPRSCSLTSSPLQDWVPYDVPRSCAIPRGRSGGRTPITRTSLRVIGPLPLPHFSTVIVSFRRVLSRPTFWESARCSSGRSRRWTVFREASHATCVCCLSDNLILRVRHIVGMVPHDSIVPP